MKIDKKKGSLIIMLTYTLLFIPLILLRYPDLRNEFKYLVIAKDMINNGNYLVMRYFGELYPDKPPIFFWILIFFKKHFPSMAYNLTLIFGCLLPAMLSNLVAFNLFSKFTTIRKSFMISYSLTLLPYLLGTAAVLRMDALMNLFIISSLAIFYSIYFEKDKPTNGKIFSIYILIGIGILVKGGAAFAVPVIAMALFLAMEGNLKFFKKIKFGTGVLVVLLIVGIWLGSLALQPQGMDYIKLLLGQETLGRALKSKAHTRPFYYYFVKFPLIFLPMTPFLLLGLYGQIKNIKNFKFWSPLDKISFTWFWGPFIFFSLLSGKLEIYLMPIFAPAMVISYLWLFKFDETKLEKWFKGFAIFFLALYTTFLFGLPYYTDNYLAKPLVEKTKELKPEKVVAYRFSDSTNLRDEVGNVETYSSKEALDGATLPENTVIFTRNKDKKQLLDGGTYQEILSNRGMALIKRK